MNISSWYLLSAQIAEKLTVLDYSCACKVFDHRETAQRQFLHTWSGEKRWIRDAGWYTTICLRAIRQPEYSAVKLIWLLPSRLDNLFISLTRRRGARPSAKMLNIPKQPRLPWAARPIITASQPVSS